MLSRREISPGIQECTLDISRLYVGKEKAAFERRWKRFYVSDPDNKSVFRRKGDKIIYLSEEIIPTRTDGRIPLLLVFGNPAPRSVASGMYFSYEGKGREHRVWRSFRETGIIDLAGEPQEKKRKLLSLDYASTFRVGLAVFFSLPTTPSKQPWTGVAGIHKLFGRSVTESIARIEKTRLDAIIERFLGMNGAVLVFQKDAYEWMKSSHKRVYCLPPTRLIQGSPARKALHAVVAEVNRHA